MPCSVLVNPVEPFVVLLIAHLVGDFVLQTEQMALKKGFVLGWLFLHALELGLITWLLCWSVAAWPVVVVVFLTHLIFDWIKPRLKGHPLRWYLVDQIAHLITLWFCAQWMVAHIDLQDMPLSTLLSFHTQVLIAAYLLVGRPLTIGMGLFLKPWLAELVKGSTEAEGGAMTGLTRSSEWIGNIERFFVLTAILGDMEILVAALLLTKAILRFKEISHGCSRKRVDYILIGTFGSVALATAVGVLAQFVMDYH